MTKPLVYIIILNWNGYEDTRECLESLKAVKYPNFRTVVVDNGSKDGSAEKLEKEFPDVQIIKGSENLGYAGGNNSGIEYAREKDADMLLLLNNDTVASPDFLDTLVEKTCADPRIGISGPKILYYKDKEKVWFAGGRIFMWLGNTLHYGNRAPDGVRFSGTVEEDYQTGCAMLITRKALEKTGILDTSYTAYFEDADLSLRAKKAGFKVICVRESVIWHKVSSSTGGGMSPGKVYLKAKSGVKFFRRHAPRIFYYSTIPIAALAYAAVFSILNASKGVRGTFRGFLKGALEGFKEF